MRAWVPIPADLEAVACPVCNGTRRDVLLPHDWFGFPVGVVSCGSCGFVYCSPRPTSRFMEMFYRRHYLLFYEGWSELTEEYIRAHYLREAAHDRVERYRPFVPAGGRVLDVGCGAGLFLAELRGARPDVTVFGVEPGRPQARYARGMLGVPVFEGSYRDLDGRGTYDLVTAFHVAEHVSDLNGFFTFLREQVVVGGHVVIESPNLEGSWRDHSMFHIAHLYAFTPPSIAQLARKHGLEVVRVLTSETGWDWPNLHAVFRRSLHSSDWRQEPTYISAETRVKVLRAQLPRWKCVMRSWAKLVLRYAGLGRWLDLWRLRRTKPS